MISMSIVNISILSRYDPVFKWRSNLLWCPVSIAEDSESRVWHKIKLRRRALLARIIHQF